GVSTDDRALDPGQSGRSIWLTLSRWRAASRVVLLAFGRQWVSHPALQLPYQHQSFRHGNLLQGFPARSDSVDPDRGESFWIRARDHGEGCAAKPAHL